MAELRTLNEEAADAGPGCCSPAAQETCCEPEAKGACCGPEHEAGTCGCSASAETVPTVPDDATRAAGAGQGPVCTGGRDGVRPVKPPVAATRR